MNKDMSKVYVLTSKQSSCYGANLYVIAVLSSEEKAWERIEEIIKNLIDSAQAFRFYITKIEISYRRVYLYYALESHNVTIKYEIIERNIE